MALCAHMHRESWLVNNFFTLQLSLCVCVCACINPKGLPANKDEVASAKSCLIFLTYSWQWTADEQWQHLMVGPSICHHMPCHSSPISSVVSNLQKLFKKEGKVQAIEICGAFSSVDGAAEVMLIMCIENCYSGWHLGISENFIYWDFVLSYICVFIFMNITESCLRHR